MRTLLTGIYAEAGSAGNDFGIQLASPDSSLYSPFGSVGVTCEKGDNAWVLTTDKVIREAGGYEVFGKEFLWGYEYVYTYDTGFSQDELIYRWAGGMYDVYGPLEVYP